MVRLIDDLLDVSRITTGKIELRYETVDLCTAVRRALDSLRAEIDARRQRIVLSQCNEPVHVHADGARIEQIVTNLVTNASKYSDPGSDIEIVVEIAENRARLVVRDDGIGIPTERLNDVFDMFVQLDASFTRRQGGIGLGLALVRSLVELHGGSVAAHSDGPGTGSEFVVELPLPAEPRGQTERVQDTATSARPRRILVIDDNRDSADSLAALLAAIGHDVKTLYSGATAVDEVVLYRPDIVLCDLAMPGSSGLDVARALRSVCKDRDLTLIATTGHGRPEDVAMARAAGFDHHVTKPVDLGRLEELMIVV